MALIKVSTTTEERKQALDNGIGYNVLKSRLQQGWPMEIAIQEPPRVRNRTDEYAMYKGEEFLEIGTLKELAEIRGVQLKTIKFYLTPTYAKRVAARKSPHNYITLTTLEDDEE